MTYVSKLRLNRLPESETGLRRVSNLKDYLACLLPTSSSLPAVRVLDDNVCTLEFQQ